MNGAFFARKRLRKLLSNDDWSCRQIRHYKLENNKWETLNRGGKSDYIRGGTEQNHLRGHCLGDMLTLFVNGRKVVETKDPTGAFDSGVAGLYVYDTGDEKLEVLFDNFLVSFPLEALFPGKRLKWQPSPQRRYTVFRTPAPSDPPYLGAVAHFSCGWFLQDFGAGVAVHGLQFVENFSWSSVWLLFVPPPNQLLHQDNCTPSRILFDRWPILKGSPQYATLQDIFAPLLAPRRESTRASKAR